MNRQPFSRSISVGMRIGVFILLLGSCAPFIYKGIQVDRARASILSVETVLDLPDTFGSVSAAAGDGAGSAESVSAEDAQTAYPEATQTLLPDADPGLPSNPIPTVTPAPLEFPTPEAPPDNAWRPPLYPAPWAVGPFDHFYFIRPVAGDEIDWGLQGDYRYGGVLPDSDIVHTGMDIADDIGTPVLAAAAGKVVWSGYGLFSGVRSPDDPYGLAVAIRHGFGFQDQRMYTIYAHMHEVDVAVGQWVEAGTPLGKVGNTGNTTGPHLHFEVRLGENSFFNTHNPELWMVPPQGWGVLVGRVTDYYGALLREKKVVVRSVQDNRYWSLRTYGPRAVNPDPYYNENLVLSDLPQGLYTVSIDYWGTRFDYEIEIFPGRVLYFTFSGKSLYSTDLPPVGGVQPFLTP